MKPRLPEVRFKVAGHWMTHIDFDPRVIRCGGIEDGVALAMVDRAGKSEGGWVIAYRDLVRMHKLASAIRSTTLAQRRAARVKGRPR